MNSGGLVNQVNSIDMIQYLFVSKHQKVHTYYFDVGFLRYAGIYQNIWIYFSFGFNSRLFRL